MSVGHYYTFGVFFKPVSADFGWSRTITSFASSIVIFTSGILGLTTGFLTDKYGPRKVVSASGLLMAIGYFLLSRLGTFPGIPVLIQFYLFYLVVGVGMSASSAPLTATVSRWFHEKRGQALGLMTVGGGLGQFLMPPFASYMIFSADWQMAYFVIGVLMAVIIISTAQLLRRDPSAKGLQPYGQQQTTIVTGKPPAPVFTVKQAIHTRTFWIIFIVAALNLITQVMVMMHLVNYATDPGTGISPTIAATFIAVIGFANVIGKLVMGPVSDHIGRKATLAICYTLAGTTMVWLIFARQIWMFYVFSALFGFAYGGWIPMFPAMMADLFGMASIGALTGIIHMGNAIGGAIGPILGGYIFDLTKSYLIAFILGAIVFYVAAALILSVKPPQHKRS